jgi:phospholipase A-2-activating protein
LKWDAHVADVVFPAVDVLRLCIRHVAVCEHFCRPGDGTQLLGVLAGWLSPATPAPVLLLSLRTLANLFRQPSGVALLHAELPAVLGSLAALPSTKPNKNIQVASATVLLNLAVLQYSKPGNPEAKAALAQALAATTDSMTEPEAQFRILVAIGTLITDDSNARELVKSSGLVKFSSACRKVSEPKKVADCAKALTQHLLQ